MKQFLLATVLFLTSTTVFAGEATVLLHVFDCVSVEQGETHDIQIWIDANELKSAAIVIPEFGAMFTGADLETDREEMNNIKLTFSRL